MTLPWADAEFRERLKVVRPEPGVRLEAHPNDHISPASFNEVAGGYIYCWHVMERTSKRDDGFLYEHGVAKTYEEALAAAEASWAKRRGEST